jgi:hypothetical protein
MRRLAFLVMLGVGGMYGGPAEPKALSVCEVLTNLSDYSGKIVTVSARIRLRGDVFLGAEDCRVVIEQNGLRLEDFIAIAWPRSPIIQKEGIAVPFSHDDDSFKRLEKALGSQENQGRAVYVIVEGLLETREPGQPLVVMRPGGPMPTGFGHLGQAPAQLIIKTVREITFRDASGRQD